MSTQLISPLAPDAGQKRSVHRDFRDPVLDMTVADVMTPGCVMISETASVADAAEAMNRHRVHAVLVVGARNGTPLGWITHRGLLGWIGRDRGDARCSDAITERVRGIRADAYISTARYALSQPGATRLLVRSWPEQQPEGVLSDFDLALAVRR